MDSNNYSEFMTDPEAVEKAFDGYTELGCRGRSRFGRLISHGQIWFAKSYTLPDMAEAELRLHKEFEILLKLNHPGVVRAGWLQDIPGAGLSLVMEQIDGENLDEFLTHATRAERRIVADDLLAAMTYVHSRDVCHLDLKPSNIMVKGHGATTRIKIIDFGMADSPGSAIFKASGGTRLFGAPEQFLTGYTSTPRSDVYSLAKLLLLLGVHTRAARRALKEDPRKRPADAGALCVLISRMRRRRRLAPIIPAFVAVAAQTFALQPHHNKPAAEQPATAAAIPADTLKDTPEAVPAASPQGVAEPLAAEPQAKAEGSVETPDSEYSRLVSEWNSELSRRADAMDKIARREDLSKEERRKLLEQMNDSIVEETHRFFLPYYNRMKQSAGMHPMSWCSIYEPSFHLVRQRMSEIYSTVAE